MQNVTNCFVDWMLMRDRLFFLDVYLNRLAIIFSKEALVKVLSKCASGNLFNAPEGNVAYFKTISQNPTFNSFFRQILRYLEKQREVGG